jgi:hypothetical protein
MPQTILRRSLLLMALVLATGGCSLFGGDEEANPPADLTDFKPTIRVKKVWSAGLGGDSEFLRLALQPATDGSRIFAAAHDGKVSAFDAVKGKRLWRVIRRQVGKLDVGRDQADGLQLGDGRTDDREDVELHVAVLDGDVAPQTENDAEAGQKGGWPGAKGWVHEVLVPDEANRPEVPSPERDPGTLF